MIYVPLDKRIPKCVNNTMASPVHININLMVFELDTSFILKTINLFKIQGCPMFTFNSDTCFQYDITGNILLFRLHKVND